VFKHNTPVNELLLIQFYLFNIGPKLHHRKLQKLRVTLFWTIFVHTLSGNCYKLSSIVTFTFLKTFDQNFSSSLNGAMLTGSVARNFQNLRYCRCRVWKTKSSPARKLKHTSSILEYLEYFCQMSSKSIVTILSYIVSKLVHFFRDTVYTAFLTDVQIIHH